jgi:serine/threonine-protein kinase
MGRRPGASSIARKRSESEYVRIADIASGGVGQVVLALRREGSFERLYAVKRLRAELRDDEDFRTMFFDEARLAGFVRHSNVVSVLDVGEDDEGPFLVMDYVEGVPLSAIVRHSQRSGTEVPLQIALRIVIDAARGLHAAHEVLGPDGEPLRLVHRDVSPQNILVGFDGVTRVTDFGVAKAFGRTTQTVTGVLKGKLGYMAPEQLRFQPVDRRADLFALGVVLYELLVGGRLYRSSEEYDGVRRILEEPPPDLGDKREDAPPRLVELVFSMLAKSPEQRPATALEVVRVLEEVLGEVEASDGRMDVSQYVGEAFAVERELQSSRARMRPTPVSVPPEGETTFIPARRRRLVAIGAGLAVLLALGTAAAWRSLGGGAVNTATDTAQGASEEPTIAEATTDPALPATPEGHPTAAGPTGADAVIPTEAAPTTTSVAAASETAPGGETAAPAGSTTDSAPAAEAPRTRGRPARRARRGGESGPSVPQWDWQ